VPLLGDTAALDAMRAAAAARSAAARAGTANVIAMLDRALR